MATHQGLAGGTRGPLPARRPAVAALLVVALTLGLVGCERAADDEARPEGLQRPPSEQVPGFVVGQVITVRGAEAAVPIEGIDDVAMGMRFRAALLALPMFEDEGAPGPVIDFDVAFGLGVGQAEPPPSAPAAGSGAGTGQETGEYVVLMLTVEGGAERDPTYDFEVQGLYRERVRSSETTLQAAERLVGAGIADVIEGIAADAAPRVADDAEVVAMLDTTEGDALLAAIREVHRRRLGAAGPRLLELLETDDIELLIASATALGRIREARAVGPLIDVISREHRELTELVLPLLGEINSAEARAYLETVAQAHERPSIRQLAREVLDDLPAGPP